MVGTIDTDSIITQLMAVERKPQDLMKARITTLQTEQNAWQAIADKLTALKTAADPMTGLDALANAAHASPRAIRPSPFVPGGLPATTRLDRRHSTSLPHTRCSPATRSPRRRISPPVAP